MSEEIKTCCGYGPDCEFDTTHPYQSYRRYSCKVCLIKTSYFKTEGEAYLKWQSLEHKAVHEDQNPAIDPLHYKNICGVKDLEAIDIITSTFGKKVSISHLHCSAMKYRLRAGRKSNNIIEDINKALWCEAKIEELSK